MYIEYNHIRNNKGSDRSLTYMLIFMLFISFLIIFGVLLFLSVRRVRNFFIKLFSCRKVDFNTRKFLFYLQSPYLKQRIKQYFSLDSRKDYIMMNSAILDGKNVICVFPLRETAKNLFDRGIKPKFAGTITLQHYRDLYLGIMIKFAKYRKTLRYIPQNNDENIEQSIKSNNKYINIYNDECNKLINEKCNNKHVKKDKMVISIDNLFLDLDSTSSSTEMAHSDDTFEIDKKFIEKFSELKNAQNIRRNVPMSLETREIFQLWDFLLFNLQKNHEDTLFLLLTVRLSKIDVDLLYIPESEIIKHSKYSYQFNNDLAKHILAYSLEAICHKTDRFEIERKPVEELKDVPLRETIIQII